VISVIDYGVANLGSMLNMLRKIGVKAQAASEPADLKSAEKIILPGVGAFDHGVEALTERGLTESLKQKVLAESVPLLGICLGMQLLGNSSEEGELPGLGLIDARCERFRFPQGEQLKVPHMGWNLLASKCTNPLLDSLDENARFYFVHSYHLVCANPDDVLAHSTYGIDFTSMVNCGNVWGTQFHPEKSHRFGMTLLRNFVGL
jgi:glutamine amidotransferase